MTLSRPGPSRDRAEHDEVDLTAAEVRAIRQELRAAGHQSLQRRCVGTSIVYAGLATVALLDHRRGDLVGAALIDSIAHYSPTARDVRRRLADPDRAVAG